MFGYIQHSEDCSQIMQRLSSSMKGNLPTPAPGFAWTQVPHPPEEWDVRLVEGQCVVVPVEVDHALALETAKRDRKDRVNEQRAIRSLVAATSFGPVAADDSSRTTLNSYVTLAAAALQSGSEYSIDWRFADNSSRTLSADEIIALGQEVAASINDTFAYSFQLKAAIDAAISLEALDAIDINTGWPGTPSPVS